MSESNKFRFAIDRGGTFTDIYAEVPGEPGVMVVKLLSEDPKNYPDAPREGIRRIISAVKGRDFAAEELPTEEIEWIRMGTTVATNALLERQGARCALLVTKGFRDLLKIGNQDRPRLFDLEIRKPELLYEEVVEVDERLRLLLDDEDPQILERTGYSVVTGITGEELAVLEKPDPEKIRAALLDLKAKGIDSLAVVLIHAYAWPEHELLIGELAREIGFKQISLSAQVMAMVKMVPRGDTAMVDAYLTPHIHAYLESFRQGFKDGLTGCNLQFMRSDGGLTSADNFTGSRAILSGPAGGVVGYAMTAAGVKEEGVEKEGRLPQVIGFDMGGTSTDVSRFGGEYELVHETETAGVRIQAPQLHIKTVAAGGGSRLFYVNGMFKVGPESAGAHPGPVCYRKNGFLALTDANLVLGRLQPDDFPHIFGPDENLALDLEASRRAFARLTEEINRDYVKQGRDPMTLEEVAYGFIQVANEEMVRPIREISVLRGFDIKEHILATFGGAGPQHAVAMARVLGINRIVIHRYAGILSAYGMGLADVVVERQRPAAEILSAGSQPELFVGLEELRHAAEAELKSQGFASAVISSALYLNLRYQGTDTALMIAAPEDGDFARKFAALYQREFGFTLSKRDIVVDDIRVRAVAAGAGLRGHRLAEATAPARLERMVSCYFAGGWQSTPVYRLEKLLAGHEISGPALIMHDTATVLIEPDAEARISRSGDIEIRVDREVSALDAATAVDPVQLSIFSNLFMSIAEQMGRTLQKTSISTNIKERLDFSCALFGPGGELVANAPHLPVHLGAMSEAVKAQILLYDGVFHEGDVLVSNHPAAGGSHLPDITVITPVLKDGKAIFFVASRGHHADVGGISPGSMPPFSRSLEDEGVAIRSFKLVAGEIFQEEGISALLKSPGDLIRGDDEKKVSGTRTLADNLSDLKAQVAANSKGIELISEMIEHYSLAVVQAYMRHVQESAESAVRRSLRALADTVAGVGDDAENLAPAVIRAQDFMDDGTPICLTLTIDHQTGSGIFDFAGTGLQVWGNTNAPLAVTKSAILYALRCLIKEELPLNQGVLVPIEIRVAPGCLLDPDAEAAVVGGNVLTSQRVVDVILKAFGVAAASQGCMNNLTFGNRNFGYYETLGGGAGAGLGWHGQSGVHTHMTNTRITDPEILERRYPVLLREFSLRPDSGGAGQFRGGDGLVRELEFLAPLNAAILSERRVFAPYGLRGGSPGARGKNTFIRADGRKVNLGGKNEIKAAVGDRLRIETPGGGGVGRVDE
ncbi:MAG: hydantoinase B/oxoprolinase family protein [Pseudomonadota bacterium]|nr:hydantoinase B/oxoprolinase family protein [Pseudomonadota bacterium]